MGFMDALKQAINGNSVPVKKPLEKPPTREEVEAASKRAEEVRKEATVTADLAKAKMTEAEATQERHDAKVALKQAEDALRLAKTGRYVKEI